jgi:hypothetical protein
MRRISLFVPEASADGLRHLAREFRARHRLAKLARSAYGNGSAQVPSCWLIPILARGVRYATVGRRAPNVTSGR